MHLLFLSGGVSPRGPHRDNLGHFLLRLIISIVIINIMIITIMKIQYDVAPRGVPLRRSAPRALPAPPKGTSP